MEMTRASMATMEEIRALAAQRVHHLTPSMLSDDVTLEQAARVLAFLRRSPVKEGGVQQAAAEPAGTVPPPLTAFKGRIPEGYYATPSLTGNNDYDFWAVKIPAGGKWEGFCFPERVLGGGTGQVPRTERLQPMQKRLALAAITSYGAEQAGALFAREMTRCRDCGRELTDEASRQAGRGPVCRGKRG